MPGMCRNGTICFCRQSTILLCPCNLVSLVALLLLQLLYPVPQ